MRDEDTLPCQIVLPRYSNEIQHNRRVLEDQGRSATSEEETLVEVQSILGPGNMFYLQHIYQLLQVEEALNQHSIA